ncbi:MAG: hypothetical protein K0S65_5492 [Labilithrix sp.]|nr:hypothetical protein [Labilithrix sp.]
MCRTSVSRSAVALAAFSFGFALAGCSGESAQIPNRPVDSTNATDPSGGGLSTTPGSGTGSRYQGYLVGPAQSWNDEPTFVLEEWVGLTNGSEVGIDLVKQGLWGTTVRDGVGGTFELTMYALAFGLAIEQLDAGSRRALSRARRLV